MPVLGINKILERVKKENIIENLGKRELENPEGVGLDLRLGSIHRINEGGAFIEVDGNSGLGKRKGVQTEEIAKYNENSPTQQEVILEPNEYYLVTTIEKINVPLDLLPHIYPRSSLYRSGLLLLVGKPDPGYYGFLTYGLTNLSKFPVKLQMGARICNIIFHTIEGEITPYRGQHQGGRLTAHEVEQQV
jgi:deoxycytidine triphosphate deaminase